MKICVIGTGYVGLVAGACLADMGNSVICVDNNREKLEQLKQGIIPIYEPGLEELVTSNTAENRLKFSSDLDDAVKKSEVCFIAVGTPQREDGSADLTYVYSVAEAIAKAMNGYKVIVDKSTVPVGTAEKVEEIIRKNTAYEFDVVSNPEFLKQGNAVDDFLLPDRVVIGSNSAKATAIMQEIYSPYLRTANRIVIMDVKSAEMTKYAANSFLATKISFMNEIAALCEKVGANAEMVRIGMATDARIGNKFLFPGVGYGGSCFPKDVKALIQTGKEQNCEMMIIQAVDKVNKRQKANFVTKIMSRFGEDLKGMTFALWGLAFKPKTNDMREAPSIYVVNELLKHGAKIHSYDPKAMETARFIFGDRIQYAQNAYDALKGADAMILMTEWNEFRRPDYEKMAELLKQKIIFDGRNQYERAKLESKGFEYYNIGEKINIHH